MLGLNKDLHDKLERNYTVFSVQSKSIHLAMALINLD